MNTQTILYITLAICITILLLFAKTLLYDSHETFENNTVGNTGIGSCNLDTCGAIDPVLDPEYNVQEVVKNMVLLEDHLNQERKRCIDCICKHFIYVISYLEEAISLAGSEKDKYPHFEEILNDLILLFKTWKKDKKNPQLLLDTATSIRQLRKVLMHKHVMN